MRLDWGPFAFALAAAALGCGSSSQDLFGDDSGGSAGDGGSLDGASGSGGSSGFGGVGGGSGGTSGTSGTGGSGTGDGGSCDFSGIWATYATIPVTWAGTIILAPGGGNIQVWILTQRTQQGTQATDQGRLCGIQLPPFQTTALGGNEKYGVRFLAEPFDLGQIPPFTMQATAQGDTPGSTYSTLPSAIVFGMTLNDPLVDPWPTSIATADHDGDGYPGVTTPAEQGAGFFNLPVDATKIQRAKELFVASRTVSLLAGTIVSCDEFGGAIQVGSIGSDPALDSAIVGCILENNTLCTPPQTEFMDANGPNFQPAPGSTLVSKRVAADTTCAHVRGMYIAQ